MEAEKQKLILVNRENLSLNGVLSVENFDSSSIHLVTNMGDLVLNGENLHISHLNLDEGEIVIQGFLHSLEYKKSREEKSLKGKSKSLLDRILK
ncbi:MAG: sporulation protein YabP [Bacillota bacterium]|jgi:sporulation protein YabP